MEDQIIEHAAQMLAECRHYPWHNLPAPGREIMRKHAAKIVAAAVAAERDRCIAVVMYELDSNGQAQAIEAEIRGVDWQNAKRKEAEDRLAKLRLQGSAAGNMWAALDGA